MKYEIMSDDDIIKDLAQKFDRLRIKKKIKETDIENEQGISRRTLYNFKQGTTAITLKSFIRLLRGIGELDQLESLLSAETEYSPRFGQEKKRPQRVRSGSEKDKDRFKWGDEE